MPAAPPLPRASSPDPRGFRISRVFAVLWLCAQIPVASAASVTSSLSGDLPIGAITPFSGDPSTIPAGFLLCNGSSYYPTQYPALFAVISYMYIPASVVALKNGVNGVTPDSYPFNVPDLRGVFPVGAGSNTSFATSVHALASFDGSEYTALSAANLPTHTHSGSTGGESASSIPAWHILYNWNSAEGGAFPGGGNFAGGSNYDANIDVTHHTHPVSVPTCDNCGGAPFRSTPPAMGLHFIIKAGPAATPSPTPCRSMLSVHDASLNGTKVYPGAPNFPVGAGNPFVTDSDETCSQQCCAVTGCVGYTFHATFLLMGTGGAPCALYSSVNGYVPSMGYSSGVSQNAFLTTAWLAGGAAAPTAYGLPALGFRSIAELFPSATQTPTPSATPSSTITPSPTSTPSQTPQAPPGTACTYPLNNLCVSGFCAPNGVCCAQDVTSSNVAACSDASSATPGSVTACVPGYNINGFRACARPAGFGCTLSSDCFSSSCLSSFCCAASVGNCVSCAGGTGACTGCGSGFDLNADHTQCVAAVPVGPSASPSPSPSGFSAVSATITSVVGFLGLVASIIGGIYLYSTRARDYLCLFCRMRYHGEIAVARLKHPLAAALYDTFLLPLPGFRGNITKADRVVVGVEAGIFGALGITPDGLDDDAASKLAARARNIYMTADGSDEYRLPPRRCCWLCGPKDSDVLEMLETLSGEVAARLCADPKTRAEFPPTMTSNPVLSQGQGTGLRVQAKSSGSTPSRLRNGPVSPASVAVNLDPSAPPSDPPSPDP